MTKTADDLANAITLAGTVPINQSLMSTASILSLAQEEMESIVYPAIDSCNQNYFVTLVTTPITVNVQNYQIPSRSVGRTLRDLKVKDGSGQIRNMALIQLEDAHFFNYQATPNCFYFMGDDIIIVPPPSDSTLQLLMYIVLRPGYLTSVQNCAQVTGISGNVITCSAVPATFVNGFLIDFIQGIEGNKTQQMDTPITNVSGNQVTFGSVPVTLAVGDYLCPAQNSCVLQIPQEGFSWLQTLTTMRVLKAIGDFEGAKALAEDAKAKQIAFQQMISPRISGEPIKIIQRIGLLRGNRSRIRRGIVYP